MADLPPDFSDASLAQQIGSGAHPSAALRIQYRQMLALERIAAVLETVADRPWPQQVAAFSAAAALEDARENSRPPEPPAAPDGAAAGGQVHGGAGGPSDPGDAGALEALS